MANKNINLEHANLTDLKEIWKKEYESLAEVFDNRLDVIMTEVLRSLELSGFDVSEAVWGMGTAVIGTQGSWEREMWNAATSFECTTYAKMLSIYDFDKSVRIISRAQFEWLRYYDELTQYRQYGFTKMDNL
jgi:hypothetical protein